VRDRQMTAANYCVVSGLIALVMHFLDSRRR
jgi:hypothetical protein